VIDCLCALVLIFSVQTENAPHHTIWVQACKVESVRARANSGRVRLDSGKVFTVPLGDLDQYFAAQGICQDRDE
jgi:hypothetical protein